MTEQPDYLMFVVFYVLLVIVGYKYRFYKEKSERLEIENISMAAKLGKEVGVCQSCDEKMIKNSHMQKYHTECYTEVNRNRVLELYHKNKKIVMKKMAVLRNGLEIRIHNIIGE